ncbi:MAG: hypothetical protein ACO2PO_18840, partial [Candidatus Calescibacterium sp.]
ARELLKPQKSKTNLFPFPFHFQVSQKSLLFFRRSCIYSSEDSNSHLKTYWSEKIQPTAKFFGCPKKQNKKGGKKVWFGHY